MSAWRKVRAARYQQSPYIQDPFAVRQHTRAPVCASEVMVATAAILRGRRLRGKECAGRGDYSDNAGAQKEALLAGADAMALRQCAMYASSKTCGRVRARSTRGR